DVWWCAASLFSKQLRLVADALLEPTAAAYVLTAGAAVAIPIAVTLAVPRRHRPWVLLGIGIVGALLVLGDIVYFRFFGDVLSAAALLGARQTGQLWGSIRQLLPRDLLWLFADLPVAAWLAVRAGRMPAPATWRPRAAAAGVLAVLAVIGGTLGPHVLASARVEQMFRNRAAVEQFGPFGYHAYDVWNYLRATWLRPSATASQIDAART